MKEKLKLFDNFQYKISQNVYFVAFALFGLLAFDKIITIPYIGLPITIIIAVSVIMVLGNGMREISNKK